MRKYYIILFTEKNYGDLVEGAETNDGLPVCNDYNVAITFVSPSELDKWVHENTSLQLGEYGIHGLYY